MKPSTPTLDALLIARTVKVAPNGDIIGQAVSLKWVRIGHIDSAEATEEYLKIRPTPFDWDSDHPEDKGQPCMWLEWPEKSAQFSN